MASRLTLEQKQFLYHNGYIIVKQAVSKELVDTALARIKRAERGENLGPTKEMTDLINASSITPILNDVMGQFDPPSTCQVGVLKKREAGDHFNNVGYRDKDMPYYGAELHMDGLITINAPQEIQKGSYDEIYNQYIRRGPKGDIGRCAEVIGDNMTPLFQDPDCTLAVGSFTAFVFVCLNDQTKPGCGQTSLLPGAHHASERFFRWQAEQGDQIGPEGPGWPRLNIDSANRSGNRYLPEAILKEFTDETSECTPDGTRWPTPVQALMEPGDACIAMYNIPHSGSRNENGTESRKNIIFRIRNKKRQPDKVLTGGSDHPDRAWTGEFLEYEEGNNPWERSKYALTHIWDEWEGMQDVVAAEEAKQSA